MQNIIFIVEKIQKFPAIMDWDLVVDDPETVCGLVAPLLNHRDRPGHLAADFQSTFCILLIIIIINLWFIICDIHLSLFIYLFIILFIYQESRLQQYSCLVDGQIWALAVFFIFLCFYIFYYGSTEP